DGTDRVSEGGLCPPELVAGGRGDPPRVPDEVPYMDIPRTFIAASTVFMRRGPKRRTSAATMRARAGGAYGSGGRPAVFWISSAQIDACASASPASFRNSARRSSDGSASATTRYRNTDSISCPQLSCA